MAGLLPDGTLQTDDRMKQLFRQSGIPVIEPKLPKTEPFGNEECMCGSGKRFDMCCSSRRLE